MPAIPVLIPTELMPTFCAMAGDAGYGATNEGVRQLIADFLRRRYVAEVTGPQINAAITAAEVACAAIS